MLVSSSRRLGTCRCGATVAPLHPTSGSFAKLRRRLDTEAPAIWIETGNTRLLLVDASTPELAPRPVHVDPATGLAFLGPWLGIPYLLEGVIAYSFDPLIAPIGLMAIAGRLGIATPPIVTPSLSTVAAIHRLARAT